MSWLANVDITPCTGSKALLDYIAKYASKAEKKTESYKDMMKNLLPTLNNRHPLLSVVTKMMNRLIGERDWSAQEVCHLLDLPLQGSSRVTLSVDCRPENVQSASFILAGGEQGSDESGEAFPIWRNI